MEGTGGDFANILGIPLAIVPEDDVAVLDSAFLAGCGYIEGRRCYQPQGRERPVSALEFLAKQFSTFERQSAL